MEDISLPNDNELINTEKGMFLIDYRDRVLPESEVLIEASLVDPDVKDELRRILKAGFDRIMDIKYRHDNTDVLARATIVELLYYLGSKDNEKNELFELLRNLILAARNSALGWESRGSI